MKRFVSLILSVCFLFSINTVSYAANISSRKASNPVIQSMNDKYHVDFSGMSIDELNKFIDRTMFLQVGFSHPAVLADRSFRLFRKF